MDTLSFALFRTLLITQPVRLTLLTLQERVGVMLDEGHHAAIANELQHRLLSPGLQGADTRQEALCLHQHLSYAAAAASRAVPHGCGRC